MTVRKVYGFFSYWKSVSIFLTIMLSIVPLYANIKGFLISPVLIFLPAIIFLVAISLPIADRTLHLSRDHLILGCLYALIWVMAFVSIISNNLNVDPGFLLLGAMGVVAFFVSVIINSEKTLRVFFISVVAVGILNSLVGVTQYLVEAEVGNPSAYFGSSKIGDRKFNMPVGLAGYTHPYAIWCVVAFCLSLSRLVWGRRSFKSVMLWGGWATLTGMGAVLSQTRSAQGLIVVCAVILIFINIILRSRISIRTVLIPFLALSVVFALIISVYVLDIGSRNLEPIGVNKEVSDFSIRSSMYAASFNEFKNNIWYGIGFGNTENIWEKYGLFYQASRGFRTHNSLLLLATESGIVAGLLFLIALWLPVIKGLRAFEILERRKDEVSHIYVGLSVALLLTNFYNIFVAVHFNPSFFILFLLMSFVMCKSPSFIRK